MDQFAKTFNNVANPYINMINKNKYISLTIAIFLSLYGGLIAPKLPKKILEFIDNGYVKFILIFAIAYTSRKDPTVALVAALGVLLTVQALNKLKVGQFIEDIQNNITKKISFSYKNKKNNHVKFNEPEQQQKKIQINEQEQLENQEQIPEPEYDETEPYSQDNEYHNI
jgi:hypothetical protein